MNAVTISGVIATILIIVCQLPQLVKVIRTNDTNGISAFSYILFVVAAISWMVYGYLISDKILITSNILTGAQSLIIIIYKLKNG